jgi:4-hydroxybenzoate polyprenyltransferase
MKENWFFNLIRWKNLVIIFLTQLTALFVFLDYTALISNEAVKLGLIFFSCLLISASGYIINDYFDVKIDKVNKPNEVYVGSKISRRKALLLHQILNFTGVVLGFFAGYKVLFINILAISLLWFYASIFKKKPLLGNLIVAFLLSLVLLEMAWVFEPLNLKLWLYAFLIFSVNLVREIVKDMEDLPGDKQHGAKTLPVVLGLVKTKNIVYGIMFGSLILLAAATFLYQNKILILNFLGLLLAYLVVFLLLRKADRKAQFDSISKFLKLFLIVGLLAALVM